MLNLVLFLSFIYTSKGNFEFRIFPYLIYRGDSIFSLEIWYSFKAVDVPFEVKGDYREGVISIEVYYENLRTGAKKKERWERKVRLKEIGKRMRIFDVFSINLKEGEYIFNIKFNTRARKGDISFRRNLKLKYPFISDILLSKRMSTRERYFFKRNNLYFDFEFPFYVFYPESLLYYYYELYGFEGNEVLIYKILKENQVVYMQKERAPRVDIGFTWGRLPVYKFPGGSYFFVIDVLRDSIVLYSDTVPFFYVSKKNLMKEKVDNYYREFLFFIDYFATSDELKEFRKLSFEGKKLFAKKFWKKFDPDPSTEVNEFLYEFVNRVRYADEHFSMGGKRKGRHTDRGRIYIKYGPPDEIESSYYPQADRAWESWIYSHPKRMQFVFSDINLDGSYKLVYSSVPEEPGVPNWQKWIPLSIIQVGP